MVIDLNPLAELDQLLFYVLSAPHRSDLHEVLHAPLCRVVCLLPLFIDVKESNVVSSRPDEVSVSIVGMNHLLFGAVEDSIPCAS